MLFYSYRSSLFLILNNQSASESLSCSVLFIKHLLKKDGSFKSKIIPKI